MFLDLSIQRNRKASGDLSPIRKNGDRGDRAFLREQALWGPVYLFSGALFVVMALLQVTRRTDAIAPAQALSIASRLLAQAVPLALVLFILFPRVPGPFWSLPQRGGSAMTGSWHRWMRSPRYSTCPSSPPCRE